MRQLRAHEEAERRIADAAARQHGVVSAAQLRALGFDASAVRRRVRAGRLHRVRPGVYVPGHVVLGPNGRRLAAVLSVAGSLMADRSSTAMWGLRPYSGRPELLVVGRGGRRQRDGVRIRRVLELYTADRAEIDGIPVTNWPRAMLDTSALIEDGHQRMIIRAEQMDLFDLHAVHAAIARAPRHRGTKPLLAALAALHPESGWTKSGLEQAMLALCVQHGLPAPTSNVMVEGYEVDFLWPAQRLVGETDSWTFHKTSKAFQGDRTRDRRLQLAGYRVLRFTEADLAGDASQVVADLRRALVGT